MVEISLITTDADGASNIKEERSDFDGETVNQDPMASFTITASNLLVSAHP